MIIGREDLLCRKQLVDADIQHMAQRQQKGNFWKPLARFPFGNGFIADGERVGKLPLGEMKGFSRFCDKSANLNLVHFFLPPEF